MNHMKFWRTFAAQIPRGLGLLGILAGCTGHSWATHITLQIRTEPRVLDQRIECRVDVSNQGDEKATNVQTHLMFQGRRHSSPAVLGLNVGATHSSSFTIPFEKLASGRHPLIVVVDYADTNGYPFTALSSADIIHGQDAPPRIHGVVDAVELSGDADLEFRIKNLEAAPRDLQVQLILPKEISATQTRQQVALDGLAERTVRFGVRNFSALEGSTYQVFALVEYDDGDRHSSLFAPGTVRIVPTTNFFARYKVAILAGAGILLLLFVAVQFWGRRK